MAIPYIFLCAGCGTLAVSERSAALTCRVSCRVTAHRSGRLKQLRAEAKAAHVPPAALLQTDAILLLCPHLEEPIMTGRMQLEDTRPEMWEAFCRKAGLEEEYMAATNATIK